MPGWGAYCGRCKLLVEAVGSPGFGVPESTWGPELKGRTVLGFGAQQNACLGGLL